jgi:hypothetical protein
MSGSKGQVGGQWVTGDRSGSARPRREVVKCYGQMTSRLCPVGDQRSGATAEGDRAAPPAPGAHFSCAMFPRTFILTVESLEPQVQPEQPGAVTRDDECIDKSRGAGQSRVSALHHPGLRDGDGAGDPLAFRDLDDHASYLFDLCHRSRRAQYPDGCFCPGLGHRDTRDSGRGSVRDLPSHGHAVHSSSPYVVTPRPIE